TLAFLREPSPNREAQALARIHSYRFGFTLGLVPASKAHLSRLCVRALPWDRQMPRAPLPARGIPSLRVVSCTTSQSITSASSLIRAHAPDQDPPHLLCSLASWVFAGCYQPLLRLGPSRRYLCESFLGCLGLYPGSSHGALAHCFPCNVGLPHLLPVG